MKPICLRQSDMYGFIVIENIVFGENTSVVVDPTEEKLKTEFTKTCFAKASTFINTKHYKLCQVYRFANTRLQIICANTKNAKPHFVKHILLKQTLQKQHLQAHKCKDIISCRQPDTKGAKMKP